jgi:uncharacterized membrane protein HdeD (DUF308 family)
MTLAMPGLITAIIAIVFGIIVMVKPQVLAYLIGIYLIIVGAIYLIQHYM